MQTSQPTISMPLDHPETTAADREEELRALRALRILLENKLIDQLEFERRLATFQDNAGDKVKG